jgi:urea transport system ATP-binding protein
VLVTLFAPKGIGGLVDLFIDYGSAPTPAPCARRRPRMSTLLEVSGVSVSFDGFKAINNLSFQIGLSRNCAPSSAPTARARPPSWTSSPARPGPTRAGALGREGHSLLSMSESQIARAGVGRKFQRPTVFEDQSVRDNLRWR